MNDSMEISKSSLVSGSLVVFLKFLRIFGGVPLWFEKQGSRFRVSVSTKICNFCRIVTFTTSCLFLFISGKICFETVFDEHVMLRVAWCVKTIMTVILANIMVFNAPRRMHYVITCLNQVQKIYTKLWYSSDLKLGTQIKYLILFVIFTNVLALVKHFAIVNQASISIHDSDYSSIKYTIFFIYEVIIQMGIIEFVAIVGIVKSGFKYVNNCLKGILKDNKVKCHRQTVCNMSSASESYSMACDLVYFVCESYGLSIMLFISTVFVFLITSIFSIITKINDVTAMSEDNTTLFQILHILWTACHLLFLFIIIEPCHDVHCEMETTRDLVSKLMLTRSPHSVYDPLAVEILLFWKQLSLRQVSFTPLQMVTLTRGFLLSILASIITYLVIMIDNK